MSVQLNTRRSFFDCFNGYLGVIKQFIARSHNTVLPKVFFRYQTHKTHPGFASFYSHPPVPWRNWHDADLLHWINYPKIIDRRPYIVESNDHPLSAVSWKKRVFEPNQVIRLIEVAKKVYEHESCKAILIPCDGFRELFQYYLPPSISEKLVEVSPITCNIKEIDWETRSKKPITFCCLASDYYLKGVDLVLHAWFSARKEGVNKLILACPNLPLDMESKVINDQSIVLIKKLPLTVAEKDSIYRASHVSIAPTHVHGGANVAESLEYGQTPIMFQYHSKLFEGLGSYISVPYHFYTPEYYGKAWKTFDDFFRRLNDDKMSGKFDCVINSLASKITEIINNPEAVIRKDNQVRDILIDRFSIEARNQKLLNIYNQALKS